MAVATSAGAPTAAAQEAPEPAPVRASSIPPAARAAGEDKQLAGRENLGKKAQSSDAAAPQNERPPLPSTSASAASAPAPGPGASARASPPVDAADSAASSSPGMDHSQREFAHGDDAPGYDGYPMPPGYRHAHGTAVSESVEGTYPVYRPPRRRYPAGPPPPRRRAMMPMPPPAAPAMMPPRHPQPPNPPHYRHYPHEYDHYEHYEQFAPYEPYDHYAHYDHYDPYHHHQYMAQPPYYYQRHHQQRRQQQQGEEEKEEAAAGSGDGADSRYALTPRAGCNGGASAADLGGPAAPAHKPEHVAGV